MDSRNRSGKSPETALRIRNIADEFAYPDVVKNEVSTLPIRNYLTNFNDFHNLVLIKSLYRF